LPNLTDDLEIRQNMHDVLVHLWYFKFRYVSKLFSRFSFIFLVKYNDITVAPVLQFFLVLLQAVFY